MADNAVFEKNQDRFKSPMQVYRPKQKDYTMLDFTNSATAQQELQRADARLGLFDNGINQYEQAAQQAAAQQAIGNIRGVGDAMAAGGGLNSGAASAAFADAALSPYYQAQQQIGAMKQQAGAQQAALGSQQDNAYFDRYTGVAAPITQQGMSEQEKRMMVGNKG